MLVVNKIEYDYQLAVSLLAAYSYILVVVDTKEL